MFMRRERVGVKSPLIRHAVASRLSLNDCIKRHWLSLKHLIEDEHFAAYTMYDLYLKELTVMKL